MATNNASHILEEEEEDTDEEEEETDEEEETNDEGEETEEEEEEDDDGNDVPLRRSARHPQSPLPNSPVPIVIEEEDGEEEAASPLLVSPDTARPTSVEGKGNCTTGSSQNEPDSFSCPICMEPWSAVGVHRTCCLPCGHVYGRSCIERWIRQGSKNFGKCPQCNKKSKLSEIRNLYVPHVVIVDEDLQKEVVSLRSENEFLKMRNGSLLEEVRGLKKRQMEREVYDKQAARREHVPLGGLKTRLFEYADDEHNTGSQNYSRRRQGGSCCSIALKDEFGVDGARVFDIDASSEILVVSRRPSGMAGVHVLTKISLLPPYENDNIQLPHDTKAVRDVRISHPPGRLALLASMGKKLSIVSMESNNVVLTYDLPVPAWSCSWDFNSPYHVYAGLQNGMLMVFDLRQTAGPMESTSGLTTHPIHTIHSISHDRLHSPSSVVRTLLTASSIGPCEWDIGGVYARPLLIPEMENQGVCISLAYCNSSSDIIASFRPKVQIPNDNVASQASLSASPTVSIQPSLPASPTVSRPAIMGSHVLVKRVGGNSYQSIGSAPCNVSEVRMPKSAIISIEDNNPLFAFGDEITHGLCVRDLPSFGVVEHLKRHPHPILDVKYARSTSLGLLSCISENRLQIFTCSGP
ncbi:uncharacterized protein LOC131230285 isoform X2 [Magnolia sinica]|uniref:uncharacterized protein LOC131230285 isoform X2 n=1 Tax=Magnolia sinica TaxID=86752 RepID=UPI00265A3539|nr:uncharacterized protein LOC131230285 isoform X2 [Magnolia sinica]